MWERLGGAPAFHPADGVLPGGNGHQRRDGPPGCTGDGVVVQAATSCHAVLGMQIREPPRYRTVTAGADGALLMAARLAFWLVTLCFTSRIVLDQLDRLAVDHRASLAGEASIARHNDLDADRARMSVIKTISEFIRRHLGACPLPSPDPCLRGKDLMRSRSIDCFVGDLDALLKPAIRLVSTSAAVRLSKATVPAVVRPVPDCCIGRKVLVSADLVQRFALGQTSQDLARRLDRVTARAAGQKVKTLRSGHVASIAIRIGRGKSGCGAGAAFPAW